MRASLLARVLAAAAGLAALAVAPPTRAAWLEEPPRLYTFKLDDPTALRLRLLDAFRDAAVEPSGGLRHSLGGPWGSWRAQPWWTLAWSDEQKARSEPATLPRLSSDEEPPGLEPELPAWPCPSF